MQSKSLVFLPTGKDPLDLQTPAESLVVQQPRLEVVDEREPRQDRNRSEDH